MGVRPPSRVRIPPSPWSWGRAGPPPRLLPSMPPRSLRWSSRAGKAGAPRRLLPAAAAVVAVFLFSGLGFGASIDARGLVVQPRQLSGLNEAQGHWAELYDRGDAPIYEALGRKRVPGHIAYEVDYTN